MKPAGLLCLSPVVLMTLSGCAINALRLEGANQISLTANAVVTQANAALDDISRRRQQAYRTLIASDPSCQPEDEIYIFVPTNAPSASIDDKSKTKDELPPLCASGKDDRRVGYRTRLLHFSSVGADRLKPTILMIAAIAEYAEAYKKIIDEPKVDISTILTSAAQKAADAKALADAVLPEPLPAIPNLETKQAKSAIALLQFLTGLAEEAHRGKDVAALYRKRASEINIILDDLKGQLGDWAIATTLGYAQIETGALRDGYRNERGKLSFEGRRAFLELIQKSELEQNGIKRTANTLANAISELKSANGALGDLLDGKLTPEQRAEAAKLNEDRIFKALKLSIEAATSWGVI